MEAFSNEALSTEYRILATKLRVISRILVSLEDPDAAVETCKLYLTKLHDLSTIGETISVYLRGEMKSLFKKIKREKCVILVAMINLEVFGFTRKFCNEVNLLTWPMLHFGDKETYHPLFLDKDSLLEMLGQVISSSTKIMEENIYQAIYVHTYIHTYIKSRSPQGFSTTIYNYTVLNGHEQTEVNLCE